MADIAVQASFNSGEWAPALFARVDIQKYRSGAALLENFFVDYRGGASTRAGTRFIYPAPDGQIRLIPFQETSELGYVLVFTHLQIQFVVRGAVVTEASFAITAATQANPAIITATSNNFLVGDLIFISGIVGMTELNDRFFLVAATGGGSTVTLNDFFGNPIDSTGYGAYVSGGTAARIYSLPSPYSGSQLKDIKYAQNVDQMVLCHPDQPPYVLEIITANNWTLTQITFGSTALAPGTLSLSSSLGVGTVNYAYQVTSVDGGGQESGPSPQGDYLLATDLRTTGGSIQIQWSAVEGAVSYNVYKADVSYIGAIPPGSTFGFIGFTSGNGGTTFIDSNIAPDFTITPPVHTNPFLGTGLFQTSVPTPSTYTTVPTVTLTGGSPVIPGSLAAVLQAQSTATVAAGGAGYALGDTVTFSNGVTLQVHSVTAGAVVAWEPFVGGPSNPGAITSGATPTNPVSQISTSGAGTGATANLVWGVGYLIILNPGSGYTSNPTAVFAPAGAVAVVTIAADFAGNPTVPGFFQQRLVLAAQTIAPQTFYMSKPGQFFNFDVSFPTRPDDSITETLVAGVLNTIEALVSSTSGMLILTDHGSWIVNGGSSGSAVSPTAIVANAQSFNGIRTQPAPIVANYDVLYPQQKGSSVRDLSFNIYFNVFTGTDISIMPSHLFFGHQIIDWCWAEEPFKVVWAIREDGVMLSCTYMKEQEFVGWAHHVTNSSFVAVASVTEPDEETGDVFVDGVYLAVERDITPSPPPPPPPGPPEPGTCDTWAPVSIDTVDLSAALPTGSQYYGPGAFYSGNWYFWRRSGIAFTWSLARIPASNYTVGGISSFNFANAGSASSGTNLTIDLGTGQLYDVEASLIGGVGYFLFKIDATGAWNSGAVTVVNPPAIPLYIPNLTNGAVAGGSFYCIVQLGGGAPSWGVLKIDETGPSVTTFLDLGSFIPNPGIGSLTYDPIHNRLFLLPVTGIETLMLIIDLTNFTSGGVTSIDMSASFVDWANISEAINNGMAIDSNNLYFCYDSLATGWTILAALDLNTLTISKLINLGECPVGIVNGVHVAPSGNVYILFSSGTPSVAANICQVNTAFTTRATYDLTSAVPNTNEYSGWAYDGAGTLYAMPAVATTGNPKTAFRIKPE